MPSHTDQYLSLAIQKSIRRIIPMVGDAANLLI